jgi:hypothetical protein
MKTCSLVLTALLIITACNERNTIGQNSPPNSQLVGTWQLVSETKIEKGDTTFSPAAATQRMIKIINPTHFSFLRHDLNAGKDSTNALFVAGGGSYTLQDSLYRENLEFCNFREWENHSFDFVVNIAKDTLVQQGREKLEGQNIDRIIIEKYVRVKN